MPDPNGTEYIKSLNYSELELRIKEIKSILTELGTKSYDSRMLRYAEVDVEEQRAAGLLQPDELLIPQHIIDKNIRREQAAYINYITQSPRAVIIEDELDPSVDMSLLEKDLTKKLRFPKWQLPSYANIDGFQANGYGIKETTFELANPGNIGEEYVELGDFAFVSDTRDLQKAEMVGRQYHFTKTRLIEECGDGTKPENFSRVQVDKIIGKQPDNNDATGSSIDKSLYNIIKVMKKQDGIVYVGWVCPDVCDDWLRKPLPLFMGRRELIPMPMVGMQVPGQPEPVDTRPVAERSKAAYETDYPYFVYPYLISENNTISQLKGRVYLDQDVQEAVTSLLSSTCTQARRAAGLYGSRDSADPSETIMMEKNIMLKSGSILNSKVSFTQLAAPAPQMFQAIQMLVASNENETSQVNFAETNKQSDSRKTATAVKASMQMAATLSTVQVVLFSIANKDQLTYEVGLIRSRVLAGLIEVNEQVLPLYKRTFIVKPSGDTDVVEKQQMIQTMMGAWEVVQNTPMAPAFLSDLIELMFPTNSAKYLRLLQQAQMAQQSQQAQQQKMLMQKAIEMGQNIVELSKHPDMFSDKGLLHALPRIEIAAQQLQQLTQQPK